MYRDLFQIHESATDPSIAPGTVKTFGPDVAIPGTENLFTLFNMRAFLIQVGASAVPAGTLFEVFLSCSFAPGTSKYPKPPTLLDDTKWARIHSDMVLTTTEPLIFEKCQTAAEWLRFRITVGAGSTLDDLDIVLAKQAWR